MLTALRKEKKSINSSCGVYVSCLPAHLVEFSLSLSLSSLLRELGYRHLLAVRPVREAQHFGWVRERLQALVAVHVPHLC